MDYNIFENGELVNTIVASEDFVKTYCLENGYTYEEVIPTNPQEPAPTDHEILMTLLGVNE